MRLNILLLAMLVGVFGMLFWIYFSMRDNARSVINLYDKQFSELIGKEQQQYQTYKQERDADFAEFKKQTALMIDAGMLKTQGTADHILAIVDSKLNQQSATITEAAKKVATTPVVVHTVEHRTEVISDEESKRRQKLKEQWDKYHRDLSAWKKQYGKHK